jgi:hypothetical protein
MIVTDYRERMRIPDDIDDDVAFNIFKSGGEVIISKDVDGGVDLCPHEWGDVEEKRAISPSLGCRVYRCTRNGCLRFVFQSRSSFDKFLWGYRSLPKIPQKLPTKGYYSDEWFARKFHMNPQTVSDYYKLIEGLDIDGVPAYIETDEGRKFFYRDSPSMERTTIEVGGVPSSTCMSLLLTSVVAIAVGAAIVGGSRLSTDEALDVSRLLSYD